MGAAERLISRCSAMRVIPIVALFVTMPASSLAESAALKEAKQHEQQARALLSEGAYEEAAIEFRRAYDLVPNFKVLYNLGNAYVALGRPVEAVDVLTSYLEEGKGRISAARHNEVEAEIRRQEARIGTVTIVAPPASRVDIDGKEIGANARSGPIRLAIGRHHIRVSAEGFVSKETTIDLAGGESLRVETTLDPVPAVDPPLVAQLIVHCDVPDVEVSVDRVVRAKTPLPVPLVVPAGVHEIGFARPGYAPRSESRLLAGSSAEAFACAMRPLKSIPTDLAARLVLKISETDVEVSVDRTSFSSDRTLPYGRHHVEVSKAGFQHWARDVVALPGTTTVLDVRLEPTRSFADDYRSQAMVRRIVSYAVAGGGAVLGASGFAVYLDNNARYERWKMRQRAIDAEWAEAAGTPDATTIEARQDQNDRYVSGILERDSTALGLGIAGAVLVAAGAVLFFTGDDPYRYSVGVTAGPNGGQATWSGAW